MSTNFCEVVIIGAGPAGLSAAVNAASEGLQVCVVEESGEIGGQAKHSSRIENYLGFPSGLTGPALMSRAENQAIRFGARFHTKGKVEKLERDGRYHTIVLGSGDEWIARATVVATGLQWRKLEATGAQDHLGVSVFYGCNMDDGPKWAGKDVMVVGGANSAGQAAMYFARFARRVHVVCRAESLEKSMSDYLVKRIRKLENVEVWTDTTVECFAEDCVVLDSEGTKHMVPCHATFIFIGAEPRTEWMAGMCDRDERGYVLAGADRMTSCQGVFAIGDVRGGSTKRIAASVGDGSAVVGRIHSYLEGI